MLTKFVESCKPRMLLALSTPTMYSPRPKIDQTQDLGQKSLRIIWRLCLDLIALTLRIFLLHNSYFHFPQIANLSLNSNFPQLHNHSTSPLPLPPYYNFCCLLFFGYLKFGGAVRRGAEPSLELLILGATLLSKRSKSNFL